MGTWRVLGALSVSEGEGGERCILKITRGERTERGLEALAEHGLPWRELQANDSIMASGRGSPERLTMSAL